MEEDSKILLLTMACIGLVSVLAAERIYNISQSLLEGFLYLVAFLGIGWGGLFLISYLVYRKVMGGEKK